MMAIGAGAEEAGRPAGAEILGGERRDEALDLELAGTSRNRLSTEGTPMVASMARRSASVSGR
jgi:hypothetical protein